MQFTDVLFLFVFLPVAWLIYLQVRKRKWANFYIFIVSLLFYACGSLSSLFILIFVLLWNYICGLQMSECQEQKQRNIQLEICLGINLLVLFVYRYLGVWFGFLDSLLPINLKGIPALMPAGLSFYMFSCLSYIFDLYREKTEVQKSFVDFGVFAAFFGRVNMGPIAHYDQMKEQLDNHPLTQQKCAVGLSLFVQGLFRKVIIADSFAAVFAALNGDTSWLGNLLFGFAYFFELYFDFSGYSRMARGIGAMFGFEIPENFNLPYTALSVQDFWRRWHISLTDWFRKYVYIPLGGNRVSAKRWVLNIGAVWLLTGLWHGATWPFLIWGLYQGALIVLEKKYLNQFLEKWPHWARHCYLVLSQLIGWTFFFSPSLLGALQVIGRYFCIGITSFAQSSALFELKGSIVLLIIAVYLASGLSSLIPLALKRVLKRRFWIWQTVGYVAMFGLCLVYLISATSQTFLYAVF